MFVRHSSSKEPKVSGCPTTYEEQSRTKVSSYSTLKAYSQGDSLTRKQEDPFPAFQRNASMPWIPLKCIEPQIPLDTKKQCLLANFCMGLQKLRTFWSFSAFLILNFEEVALRKRSTFKGFERYQLHLPQVLLCSITAFCPQRLLLHSFLKIPHSQEVSWKRYLFYVHPNSKPGRLVVHHYFDQEERKLFYNIITHWWRWGQAEKVCRSDLLLQFLRL